MCFAPLSRLILRQDQKTCAYDRGSQVSTRNATIIRYLFADGIAVAARGNSIRPCLEVIRFLIEESGKFRVILEGVSDVCHLLPL
jgi:hypothetical protein